MITLSEATRTGRLAEFIAQEEARGIGPADKKKLAALLKKAATTMPPTKRQTSGSRTGGYLRGK